MKTEEEVREWLKDLSEYAAMSPEQDQALNTARQTLLWVLEDDASASDS